MVTLLFNVLHVSGAESLQFFSRKGLDLSFCVGNVFRLYLLQLIPIQSRFHQEVAKIDLLCISFTQRFRGRITSNFCCWKALDLYFECPSKFWSLSATTGVDGYILRNIIILKISEKIRKRNVCPT